MGKGDAKAKVATPANPEAFATEAVDWTAAGYVT